MFTSLFLWYKFKFVTAFINSRSILKSVSPLKKSDLCMDVAVAIGKRHCIFCVSQVVPLIISYTCSVR